jgi:hypothetical protein
MKRPKIDMSFMRKRTRLKNVSRVQRMGERERERLVTVKHLWRNCLSAAHETKNCQSPYRGRRCVNNHSTLLHKEETMPGIMIISDVHNLERGGLDTNPARLHK